MASYVCYVGHEYHTVLYDVIEVVPNGIQVKQWPNLKLTFNLDDFHGTHAKN